MSSSEQDTEATPEAAAPADTAERMADAAARDYDITAGEERLVRRPMPTLDVVHDRFARNLRQGLFQLVSRSADIAIEPV